MSKIELFRRYIVYISGLYVFSFGIALVARSTMGATPVSSWAYSMSINTPLSYGTYSFLIHLVMIAYQIAILYGDGLKSEFWNIMLQLPFSFLFGMFLDINMYLTQAIVPDSLYACISILLIACMVHAFGVFMQVSANVTMMSAEGFVYYTCKRWNLKFWKTKIIFDVSMVCIAIMTSLLFNFSFSSITRVVREGTLIDALSVGRIYRFYTHRIKFIDYFISWSKNCKNNALH